MVFLILYFRTKHHFFGPICSKIQVPKAIKTRTAMDWIFFNLEFIPTNGLDFEKLKLCQFHRNPSFNFNIQYNIDLENVKKNACMRQKVMPSGNLFTVWGVDILLHGVSECTWPALESKVGNYCGYFCHNSP